jgi:plastocyanin
MAQAITTTGNFTFSPSVLTVMAGTDIALTIGGGHTMTEVSEVTWNANGNASNGAFNYNAGNHTLNLSIPGIYYYVCQPHASMGMKGRIIVETNTNVTENNDDGTFQLFPNPANETLSVTTSGNQVLRVIDIQGREVLQHRLTGSDRISVTHLAQGNYTALLEDFNGTSVARRQLTITR